MECSHDRKVTHVQNKKDKQICQWDKTKEGSSNKTNNSETLKHKGHRAGISDDQPSFESLKISNIADELSQL